VAFDSLMRKWQEEARKADRAREYLRAEQTTRSTSVLAPPQLRTLYYTPLRWCELITGALEERVGITDLTADSARVAKFLRTTWRDIDGPLLSSRVHNAALGAGRAYVSVTSNEDGSVRASMLTAKSTVHEIDPDTGELTEALRVYGKDGDRATFYQRGRNTFLRKDDYLGWQVTGVDEHGFDRLSIVVFSQRSQRPDGYGEPVAKGVWKLQDAATRVATDGAIAGALMAVPQRVILGATAEEQKQSTEKLYLARLLTFTKGDAKIEQFAAAQLQQFGTLLNMYARQAASITAIPITMFGVTSDSNPQSGDSARQDDSRITRRAERISRDFTPAWQLVEQLFLDFYDGPVSDDVRRSVSVTWLDASAPSRSELADMGLKLASAKYGPDGRPLVSQRFILRKLGLTETEIDEELASIDDGALAQLLKEVPQNDPTGNPPTTGQPQPSLPGPTG
jgi:hypothetical protein